MRVKEQVGARLVNQMVRILSRPVAILQSFSLVNGFSTSLAAACTRNPVDSRADDQEKNGGGNDVPPPFEDRDC